MSVLFSEREKKIIARLSSDMPDSNRPFNVIAGELGMKESGLLKKIRCWNEKGIIRKFGAILNHNVVGYNDNAMVVWKAPHDKVIEIGNIMASFSEVSHCYERRPAREWPYNLFIVVHGQTRSECECVIDGICSKTGIKDYKVLYSTRQFKKTGMRYFSD